VKWAIEKLYINQKQSLIQQKKMVKQLNLHMESVTNQYKILRTHLHIWQPWQHLTRSF